VDTPNIAGGLIGFSFGLVLTLITLWADHRLQKRRDRALDERQRPQLALMLFSHQLGPGEEAHELIYMLGHRKLKAQDSVICDARFGIRNNGEVTARGIRLTIAWPLALKESVEQPGVEVVAKGPACDESYHSSVDIQAPYHYRTHFIDSIDPGDEIGVVDKIEVAHASGFPFDVEAETADGAPVKASLFVQLRMQPAYAVLRAHDMVPRTYSFTVRSFSVEKPHEVAKELRARTIADASESGEGRWVQALLVRPELTRLPKPKELKVSEVDIYVQQKPNSGIWMLSRWEKTADHPRRRPQLDLLETRRVLVDRGALAQRSIAKLRSCLTKGKRLSAFIARRRR